MWLILILFVIFVIDANPWIISTGFGILILFICGIIIKGLIRQDETEQFCSSQDCVKLQKLFENCNYVNKDFRILQIHFCSGDVKGFINYSIRFQDLGKRVIIPWRDSLEWVDKKAGMDYQSSYNTRLGIQKGADTEFYKKLFQENSLMPENLVIRSPFEFYASSGGKCVVDADRWKVDEDDAIYMDILEFRSDKNDAILCAIENTARKMLSGVRISRFSNNCYINF